MFMFRHLHQKEMPSGHLLRKEVLGESEGRFFYQMPFDEKRPNDYFLVEGEILGGTKTEMYLFNVTRIICSFLETGDALPIKVGDKISVRGGELLVFVDKNLPKRLFTGVYKIQLLSEKISKYNGFEGAKIFDKDCIITVSLDSCFIKDGFLEAMIPNDFDKGEFWFKKIPVSDIRTIFNEHNSILWLNDNHHDILDNTFSWGKGPGGRVFRVDLRLLKICT